jgi:hypothetical protein
METFVIVLLPVAATFFPIMELPVQSAICEPIVGTELAEDADEVTVKGYAYSGGGRGIVRVDVSTDGGKTWNAAVLNQPKQPLYKTFAWTCSNNWLTNGRLYRKFHDGRNALKVNIMPIY